MAEHLWAVRRRRGGPWDWSRDLREQDGWEEHAAFMETLEEERFIVVGGPIDGEREVLHIVRAQSEQAVHDRLAEDNWTKDGRLETVSVEGFTALLDSR